MKSFLLTGWKMLRYRSVLILVLFMLLSVALHTNGMMLPVGAEIAAVIILAFSYLCATCANDLVDWKIDQINLKGNSERPLVNGMGTRRQLVILLVIGAVVSIALGFILDTRLGLLMVGSIILNLFYSLPPFRVSYRALLTPFYLAFCYVVVSYLVGYVLATRYDSNVQFEWGYLVAFYCFFVARISLKDFRDRKGDAAVGKPTIILKYGKAAVSVLSTSAALLGSAVLIILSRNQPLLVALLILFTASILFVEYRIYRATKLDRELLSIAYGARMGNGLLLTFLGWVLLRGQGAPLDVLVIFSLTMLFVYGYMFWFYVKHTDKFLVGGRKMEMK